MINITNVLLIGPGGHLDAANFFAAPAKRAPPKKAAAAGDAKPAAPKKPPPAKPPASKRGAAPRKPPAPKEPLCPKKSAAPKLIPAVCKLIRGMGAPLPVGPVTAPLLGLRYKSLPAYVDLPFTVPKGRPQPIGGDPTQPIPKFAFPI